MLKKMTYPYEYMDGVEKFKEEKLPPKEMFSSSLNFGKIIGSGKEIISNEISDEDYLRAQEIFKTFNCKNLSDFTKVNCKSDVLLLADVFETFIDVCLKKYELDPSHYITAPSLSMDAMLKMTKVKLELLTDPDMYLFFEKGIRGGNSTITGRYAKANNKYLKNYDPKKENVFIQCLDANNLYGWAMSQPLPVGNFRWILEAQIKYYEKNPSDITSCTLEVDLEYPKEVHDLHNDYPLAPEIVEVNGTKKLIPHLGNRKNYVIHYEGLRQCLKYGMKLTKIHRGIQYEESDFLSKYIANNTESRKLAKKEFEKDFYKLMNNSVFGKTMEDVRGRSKIIIANGQDTEKLEKLIAKPNYNGAFDSNLVSVNMGNSSVCLNKPIYLGQTILDVSKILMYDFYYDYVKPKYGESARLLFTDTDSLCCEFQTDDFYEDISKDVLKWFDTSNYPKNHFTQSDENKKVLGKMKDEAAGKIITEFVGLRSKLYAQL